MNRRDWLGLIGLLTLGVSSSHAAEQAIDLKPFVRINSDLSAEFEFTPDNAHRVLIDAEPKVLKQIKVTVANRVLTVHATGSFQTRKPIRLRVFAPALSAISMAGTASFSTENLTADRFELKARDSASVEINKLNVRLLASDLADSSTASVAGNVVSQHVTVQGSASFEAQKLKSETATVEVSDAADAVLHVTNELKVHVSDSGSVSYLGSPKLSKSVTDAGDLEKI